MLPQQLAAFLAKESTSGFIKCARDFISLLENNSIDRVSFSQEVHLALADLYAKGQRLEEVPVNFTDPKINIDQKVIFEDLNIGKVAEFEEWACYWEVDPTLAISLIQPTQGLLTDDFAYIYRDLKIELTKLKLGTPPAVEDSLRQLKWGHSHRWGHRCIDSLRFLHYSRLVHAFE